LVHDSNNSKEYAIKRTLCQTEDALSASQKEIKVFQQFTHKNIMALYSYDIQPSSKIPDSQEVILLLPFYKRGTLYDHLVVQMASKIYLKEDFIIRMFIQICDAVREFHKKQLVHNDLKPGNILLTDDDVPMLMDFGSVSAARHLISSRQDALELQEYADSHCTPAYRAPELFDVGSEAIIDERTDVLSLGCTLYAMAYYQSPFDVEAENSSISLAVKNGKVNFPPNSNFSKKFQELIVWILNRDIQKRPFLDEVIEKLEKYNS